MSSVLYLASGDMYDIALHCLGRICRLARQASRDLEVLSHHVPQGTNIILVPIWASLFTRCTLLSTAPCATRPPNQATSGMRCATCGRSTSSGGSCLAGTRKRASKRQTVLGVNAASHITFGQGPYRVARVKACSTWSFA